MVTRKPLVMGDDGVPQNLQPGDQLQAATAMADTRTQQNDEATAALVLGAPVYISGAGKVRRANGAAKATAKVLGLVYDSSIAAQASGAIVTDGMLVGTMAQWDAVAGTNGGLTPGATYFLDPASAGRITATPPNTAGQVNVILGMALSSTDLEVNIGDPILL